MTDQPFVVERPGIYLGVLDADYHRDPVPGGSLSSTGARKLLPPSCPALFRHWLDNGQGTKPVFEHGKAAHQRVLGVGPDLVLVDRDRWDTKEVKARVAAIREAGGVPLKRADMEQVDAMAAKIREHPLAGRLLDPDRGQAEVSLFWQDPETRVRCRARLDWAPDPGAGRPLLVDYKTCDSAEPEKLEKAVNQYGYHVQRGHYLPGAKATGLVGEDAELLFVFQEKRPPYLVTVVELHPVAKRIGEHLAREARHLYRECTTSGRWPGYADDVVLLSLPGYVENRYQELM
ncbi:PD-(D/E)XK nuclease-like domain-containing protein [Micromonospora sp. WMMD998]|uniref:PD-(D/E)XK nuclease-like domain-containing protein n=1 Tax=Micromonospora sp. WMMD998 TaxID=3016092 RepID=UPI00249C0F8E|nr:PD-(D/E)XK nuclease-like domain-containing protein [Micromonospora sp. WMMD998]WFE41921.1 PD-(D/E)XK nuclease-like domain-containing protein [Micromonospora sp. WMMD998]